jgi:hypothetical protein
MLSEEKCHEIFRIRSMLCLFPPMVAIEIPVMVSKETGNEGSVTQPIHILFPPILTETMLSEEVSNPGQNRVRIGLDIVI